MEQHEELKDMVLEALEKHKQVRTVLRQMDRMALKQWSGWLSLIFLLVGCASYRAAGQVQSGRQALLINRPEDALAYFQQVAHSDPNYIFQSETYREGIWTYVGRSQYSLGRLAEARQSLERALSIYRDDYLAQLYLGLTLIRSGEDPKGFKELASGMRGLYDWLEYKNRTMPFTAFWDPRGEIRSELQKDLDQLSGTDIDRAQLVSSAEWIGQRMEEEIDLVRRDEQRLYDRDSDWFRGRGVGIGIGIGF